MRGRSPPVVVTWVHAAVLPASVAASVPASAPTCSDDEHPAARTAAVAETAAVIPNLTRDKALIGSPRSVDPQNVHAGAVFPAPGGFRGLFVREERSFGNVRRRHDHLEHVAPLDGS